jgi:ABC-type lipoprotein export system ATPase subunit
MVTHDISLKSYADRVIHMVDGKILRIEHISEQQRLAADTELQAKITAIKQGTVHLHDSEKNKNSQATTELRDTNNFYDYLRPPNIQ